jgi:hypothetical protein
MSFHIEKQTSTTTRTRTSMRVPLKPQSTQQMNLVRIQLSPPFKLPLPTSPPTQRSQFLFLLLAHSVDIGIGYLSFEVAVPCSSAVCLKVTVVGIP